MFDAALADERSETADNFPDEPGTGVADQSPPALDSMDGCARSVISAISQALRSTGYPALRAVDVEFDRGIAILWGRVPCYHQKQLAQSVARQVSGVRGIANGIEVVSSR